MRKSAGILVLALGVLVLGLWARSVHAPQMQQKIMAAAAQVMAGSVHGAQAEVSGRDIHVTGTLDGDAERDRIMAALMAVPGQRVITQDVTVLETVSPFTLQADKAPDGALSGSGFVNTEAARADLAAILGDAAAGLTLAAGAPAGWADLAKAGLAALGPMTHGGLTLSDGALTLRGEVLGPDQAAAVQAALAGLPAGSAQVDLTLLDDGTPAAYDLVYSATEGARLSGKLPPGLDVGALALTVGLPAIISDATQGLLGEAGDVAVFSGLKGMMGQFERLTVSMRLQGPMIDATASAGLDAAALQSGLAGAMPGFEVVVASDDAARENGAVRVNAATGLTQRFMGGFWLEVPQFDLSHAGCQRSVDAVLNGARIEFQSGSDALDGTAVAVINTLGSYIVRCAEEVGLKAEIGGHTDSQGNVADNLGLSQRRAVAVRKELIARGVPAGALRAQGFGDTVPIADNATEAGRAQNRRTTIVWSQ